MHAGLILPFVLLMPGSRCEASSIFELTGKTSGVLNKTYAFNVIPFEIKPMELSPEALNRQKLRLGYRNGIQLAMAIDSEALVPIQCGVGDVKVAGVQVAKIDTSQIYCVWLPNGDLVAGRASRVEGLYPVVLIEVDELFLRRRPGDRTIGK